MRRAVVIYGTAAAVSLGAIGYAAFEDSHDAATVPVSDDTVIACEIDLDDHPTRGEVIAILGEPVDVEHDEGSDNLDGSEWLPATDTLTWADGNLVSFDADTDRASSWAMDDPRVC